MGSSTSTYREYTYPNKDEFLDENIFTYLHPAEFKEIQIDKNDPRSVTGYNEHPDFKVKRNGYISLNFTIENVKWWLSHFINQQKEIRFDTDGCYLDNKLIKELNEWLLPQNYILDTNEDNFINLVNEETDALIYYLRKSTCKEHNSQHTNHNTS